MRKEKTLLLDEVKEKIDASTELNKDYYYFQANENIARNTLFTNQALHTLYKFIGEETDDGVLCVSCSCKGYYFNYDKDSGVSIKNEKGEDIDAPYL